MTTNDRVYVKVLVLGDARVGKTALMHRFVYDTFNAYYQPTIGVEFLTKDNNVENKTVTFQIWDTSGASDFHKIVRRYSHDADCCILVYDVGDEESFHALDTYRKNFLSNVATENQSGFPFIVIGNKIDQDRRIVTIGHALRWCNKNDSMPYYETTARDGNLNIEDAFHALGRATLTYLGVK